MSESVTVNRLGTTEINVSSESFSAQLTVAMTRPQVEITVLAGAPGPPGPAGASTGGANPYVHQQSTASAEWIVNHNLGRKPSGVSVLTPGGLLTVSEIIHTSDNQLRVNLAAPTTGTVLAL